MKIGDLIESAIWLTGEESPEDRQRYEADVIEAMDYFCSKHRFIHGPVVFIEKKPGQDRVPEVPLHIIQPQTGNIRLLVAEAEIVGKAPETSIGSFVANLDKTDLERLRTITRQTRMKLHKQSLSDAECDEIIEEIGPDAALDVLWRQTKPFGILH